MIINNANSCEIEMNYDTLDLVVTATDLVLF